MAQEEKCVFCDAVIPEGRQVCPNCEKMQFRECTECRHFVWCEFPKQVFHKQTHIPCERFEEVKK